MEQIYENIISLLAALGIGLLIGIERGWSDRHEKEGDRIAGIRTFTIIGLLGGMWGLLSHEMSDWIIAVAFLGVSALIIATYIIDAQQNNDFGATTAFTMMLTFVLAAWAIFGHEIMALGVTAVVIALLGYKPIIHRWLEKVEEKEIFAGIKLLIISIVLLPVLPNEGYGPWEALNPYWIWWMVVLITGLSFLGYIAIKIAGNRVGTLLTALTGGLASSTAVTLSLAQFARENTSKNLFIGGVLFASSVKFVRVFIEVMVVNYSLIYILWIPLAAMFACILAGGIWIWNISETEEDEAEEMHNVKNPFKIGMALKFGVLLAIVLLLSEFMMETYGDKGIYALAIVSGLINIDAIVLTISNMAWGSLSSEVATMGIVLATATSVLVKGAIFAFIAGFKHSIKLFLILIASVIPAILIAFYLL